MCDICANEMSIFKNSSILEMAKQMPLIMMRNHQEPLEKEIAKLKEVIAVARWGLNEIASWEEGQKVNGSFDEPGSASIARDTLAKIEALGE